MVELATTSLNEYYMDGKVCQDNWSEVCDIDFAAEYNYGVASLLYPAGKTINGNGGQTLYPRSSKELKRSMNENVRININNLTTVNQRSCAIAHEFGHVVLYLKGLPHSHQANADFIYGHEWNVMKLLGYDYLESPTGKIFR